MQSSLASLSVELSKLVEEFQPHVVAVHARPHYPSSGVHWRPGVIVTAAHTVRRDEDIQVTVHDGKTLPATLVGRDPGTDVAVLKVDGLRSVAAKTSESSAAKVGELALVIARSPNSGANASLGIISAVSGPWRSWRGGRLEQYIRLDATLFPNSSGGAVVDCRGQLIGIATSALSRIAGLAIPVSTVNRVTDALLEKGHVPRGFLGIGIQPVAIPEALRSSLSLSNTSGVMAVSVEPGGPAEKAGMLLGDILVSLGGTQLEDFGDLQSFLDSRVIGKPVGAKIIRAGKVQEVSIQIGERE